MIKFTVICVFLTASTESTGLFLRVLPKADQKQFQSQILPLQYWGRYFFCFFLYFSLPLRFIYKVTADSNEIHQMLIVQCLVEWRGIN